MKQQLREILAMTRSLPADLRQLRTMVEDRHQKLARRATAQGPVAFENSATGAEVRLCPLGDLRLAACFRS